MHPFPQAAAIASEDYKNLKGCTYCGFCHGYPCHVNAKQTAHVTSVPDGLATGNLDIIPFARVVGVTHRGGRLSVSAARADARATAGEVDYSDAIPLGAFGEGEE